MIKIFTQKIIKICKRLKYMKKSKNILVIKIVENDIVLELVKVIDSKSEEVKIIDSLQWGDDGNTSKELLRKIDEFLQKNDLVVQDLLEVKTDIDKNQKYTLARIVQIIAETINYCLQENI